MIHVISTSANLEQNRDSRKNQYLEGVKSIIDNYKMVPYIVESYGTNFLSEHCTGERRYSENKGVNELLNIEHFLNTFSHKFNDEDDIIKTTLRYRITSSVFLDTIKNNKFDIYCMKSSKVHGANDPGVFSFLLSMKYKCWKEFILSVDRNLDRDYPIEWKFAEYVKKKNTMYVDTLGMYVMPLRYYSPFNI